MVNISPLSSSSRRGINPTHRSNRLKISFQHVVIIVAALFGLCSQLYFAFWGPLHNPTNELSSEHNMVAESLVSRAMQAQRNIWPPNSVCRNKHEQPRALLSLHHVRKEVKKYYQRQVLPQNKTPGMAELAEKLLKRAKFFNQTLLTFQIGGMDGVSNDPMHRIFVKNPEFASLLPHWMPVVVEGAANNFAKLTSNYQQIAKNNDTSIPCSMIAQWAIAYNQTKPNNVCEFCRFREITNDTPTLCKEQPEWMQTQVGTVNCKHSQKVMGEVFDQCFVRDKVDCGSTMDLFRRQVLSEEVASRIAILQIDTEGYESVILPHLIREFEKKQYDLPPVIHYESKIMRKWMRRGKNRALEEIHALLKERGFVIFEGKQDDLAIQVSSPTIAKAAK